MRILLVEDEAKVARFIAEGLRELGFAVDVASDGEFGLYHARNTAYDLIILDVLLPKRDGFEVVAELRAAGSATLVLMLTARGGVRDRVRGLDAGADDYLSKPFNFDELLARIRALLRRGKAEGPLVLRCADLELDSRIHRVTRGGKVVALTTKQFAVLEFLLRHANEVVTRSQLAAHVWDENFDASSNVIDVTLHHLRDRIDRPHGLRLLHTIRGVGYILRADLGSETGEAEGGTTRRSRPGGSR